jgi:hypothetical protein
MIKTLMTMIREFITWGVTVDKDTTNYKDFVNEFAEEF